MGEGYKYSIVIPHYNSVKLLERMLNSIPDRLDIQIIVVDDCSPGNVQIDLQKLTHRGLELYLESENKGAGHARNIGIKHALGRWLIVVDSDDEFKENAFDVFDIHTGTEIDFLCFLSDPLDEETKLPTKESVPANYAVSEYVKNPTKRAYNYFKYRNMVCWNKLVSMDYIRKYNITFEECLVNNDVFYALQVCYFSDNFKAIPDVLYTYYINNKSLTHSKRTIEKEFQFYLQAQKRNGYCKRLGLRHYPFYRSTLLYIPFIIKKRGIVDGCKFFMYCYEHRNQISQSRKAYLSIFDKKSNS